VIGAGLAALMGLGALPGAYAYAHWKGKAEAMAESKAVEMAARNDRLASVLVAVARVAEGSADAIRGEGERARVLEVELGVLRDAYLTREKEHDAAIARVRADAANAFKAQGEAFTARIESLEETLAKHVDALDLAVRAETALRDALASVDASVPAGASVYFLADEARAVIFADARKIGALEKRLARKKGAR
jgi:hypothetical protein